MTMAVIEELVTDHLDLWSSALKRKSTAGRGSSSKVELYGIKKLRELILELAVRGLLVPQDPNDEPASELLKKIAAEKAKNEKRSKSSEQALPEVTEQEYPFSAPSGWAFERIGNLVVKLGSGSTPRGGNEAYVREGVPFLRSQNIWSDGIDLSDVVYISPETHAKMDGTKVFPDDILLNITGASIGRSTIFPATLVEANVSQHVTIIRLLQPSMGRFVHLGILSPMIQKLVWDRQVGMAIGGLSKKVLEMFEFPIPPLAEQHRIVAKVDELMALCDQLESETETHLSAHQTLVETLLYALTRVSDAAEFKSAWQRLAEHFDSLFTTEESIDQLKQTILQLAVMGKLVPQDPNDEPASELLKKIAAEKARLVKEGKIKKEKPLPLVSDKEKSFAIPKGWQWCKFGVLAEFINGDRSKNYPNQNEYVQTGIPWINTGHIEPNGTLSTTEMNFITREKFESLRSGKIQPGDLVYCLRGATFGKTAFVTPYSEGAIASSLMIVRPYLREIAKYIYRYLISSLGRDQIYRFDNGSAQPNLSANSVTLFVIPLPPLQEQQRIVSKIDELYVLCDQLKSRLSEAQTTQLHLADAMAEKALARA